MHPQENHVKNHGKGELSLFTLCWEGETKGTNTIMSSEQQFLLLMIFKTRLEKRQGSKQELKGAICCGGRMGPHDSSPPWYE